MLGTTFYNESIKKAIVGFGTLFNNIELRRSDEVMKVPLAYGPKAKFLARLDQVPDPTNKRVQITLPRISFEINGLEYDSTRKVSPTQKVRIASTSEKNKNMFMPVPYNLSFEMGIISKNQEDALQIVEQILPFFQPHYNLSIKLVPTMNETRDVPIVLTNVEYEDIYEGEFAVRRAITYTLQFTMKTYLYGPVTESKVIKKTITDMYTDVNTTSAPREVRYTIQPNPISADADDDFGFGIVDSDFTDNKKRNPTSGADEAIT